MSTIVTRAGKGGPLTFAEADANFTNLNTDKYQSGNNASFGTLAATGTTNTPITGDSTASIGFRNRIINGDMRIDQRNAGASIAATNTGVFPVDRWIAFEDTDGTAQVQRITTTPPAGYTNALRFAVTSADGTLAAAQFAIIQQRIEGFNVADLDFGKATAKTITVSFLVRSSVTGTFGGSVRSAPTVRSYPFTYTISAANTWEAKTVTIPGDTSGTWLTDSGIGMTIAFGLGVGSTNSGTAGAWATGDFFSATGATNLMATNGATFDITGVQLEVGATATPFERRPFGLEFALCQRYHYGIRSAGTFYLGMMQATAGATGIFAMTMPVTMRVAPTAFDGNSGTFQALTAGAGTTNVTLTLNVANGSPQSVRIDVSGAAGLVAGNASDLLVNAGGYFGLTAEL